MLYCYNYKHTERERERERERVAYFSRAPASGEHMRGITYIACPFLSPATLLSLKPFPSLKPSSFSSPARSQTRAMAKTLDESDVGITCYVSSLPGFRGVLKQRLASAPTLKTLAYSFSQSLQFLSLSLSLSAYSYSTLPDASGCY